MRAAFDTGFRRQIRHSLERRNVLGAAIGITGIINGVHADEEIRAFQHFRPCQSVAQKDGVARRDVSNRNALRALFRNVYIRRKRAPPKHSQIDFHHSMLMYVEVPRHTGGRFQFHSMPLAIIEGQRIAFEVIPPRHAQARRRIQASAQEAHGVSADSHTSMVRTRAA